MTTMNADLTGLRSVQHEHGAGPCGSHEWPSLSTGKVISSACFNVARGVSLVAASLFFCALQVSAQPVPLGTAASYGVLAASAITSTGLTVVRGDLGLVPGNASSVTGFTFSTPPGPGQVIGTTHFADAVAVTAKSDATTAYNTLAGRACNTLITGDLGGRTLTPGVYCSASAMGLTGTLTLDASGDPNAVFIFQLGSALTTASTSQVRLINSAQSCGVFWQIGSSATLGTGSSFAGTMLASSSITVTTGASNSGRAIALNGAVTVDGSNMTVCSLVASSNPSISKTFRPSTINAGANSVLTIVLSNSNAAVATLTGPLTDNLPAGVVIASIPNASTTCTGAAAPSAVAGGSTVSLLAGASIPANGSCSLSVSVTSALAGSYVNTIPVGALVTSAGNNLAPAIATLNVLAVIVPLVPSISKSFTPSTINAGATSVLTVVLSNPNTSPATLTAPLVDTLPSGVVIANVPNASTTCTGAAAPSAVAGGSTVSLLAGASIPANGSCALSVSVTSALAGTYVNTIPAGALVTSAGNNLAPAIATLNVLVGVVPPIPPGATAVGVPTLSMWALVLSIVMLTIAAASVLQKRQKRLTSNSKPNP